MRILVVSSVIVFILPQTQPEGKFCAVDPELASEQAFPVRYTSAQHRFGANLRAIREEKGLTQERLALDAGFHRAYVGSLERGNYNVTLGVVVHLARFLGVPATALVEGVEQGDDAPVFRTNKLNR